MSRFSIFALSAFLPFVALAADLSAYKGESPEKCIFYPEFSHLLHPAICSTIVVGAAGCGWVRRGEEEGRAAGGGFI